MLVTPPTRDEPDPSDRPPDRDPEVRAPRSSPPRPDPGPALRGAPDRPTPTRTDPDPALDRLQRTYHEVHPRLWRAVLAWSGSPHVADEATAEAFAQAVRRGAELRDPAAWVWRAAFRIAAGEMARQRRSAPTDLGDLDPEAPAMSLPEESIDLLRALRHLTDHQRQAVVLTDGAGFTAPEAARLMGTTAINVRAHASRARRRLRTLLSPPSDHTTPTNPEIDR